MAINKSQETIWENIGCFEYAQVNFDPDYGSAIVEVELFFSNGVCCIGVDEDNDTIIVNMFPRSDIHKNKALNMSEDLENIFKKIKEYTLLWAWELTNQQGYKDGIQLEFTNREIGDKSNTIVQFIVAASTIKVYVPKRIA